MRAVAIRVNVVPHTHWDREWYSPFQTFRLRLVDLLDDLLPRLEGDPSYAHFLLDGQMAVVDDYLEVRPEAEDVLRRLNASGRMAMGPWYILMDEFLVSGETMWRNLQLGLERAARFGGAMEVGYLPDMFGHVAQMPQLLRQAGLEHAVVWRGVPSTVDRDAFWWRSPDGSTVRAQYLWPEGYGNGAVLPDDAKELLDLVRAHRTAMGDAFTGSILWMNGTDHQTPRPWLGRVVDEANRIQDEYELHVVPLAEHVRTAPVEGLPSHDGELRSGARANLLMGVVSNRVDVRLAAARAERALERRAEPLAALFLPADRWPRALLDLAWREVVRNSAHDSICACSHDEVVDAVLHRCNEARQIADGLAGRALEVVAAATGHVGPVVVNPSARERHGVIQVLVDGDGDLPGAQVLEERPAVIVDETVAGRDLASVLDRYRSQQLDDRLFVNHVEIDDHGDAVDVTLRCNHRMTANVVLADVKAELYALAEVRPEAPFRVRLVQPPVRKALVRASAPGFGWRAFEPAPLDVDPVVTDGRRLANGLVEVVVAPNGTFAVDGVEGFDRLVDDGDAGDTYNYSPPEHDTVVDAPARVETRLLEQGPLRSRIRVTRTYDLPERISARRRVGSKPFVVETTIELRAGEPFVRLTTGWENAHDDHRLRTWLPLPQRATTSTAECAFGTVVRGTVAEGGPTERALPTYPAKRFVQAGGLTVLHEAITELSLIHI